jgi:hypothetical protein
MKFPNFRRERFVRTSALAALGWSLILYSSLASANPVDPPSVDEALAPSQFTLVEKTVLTPEIPPRPDIVFLSDTTGSMGAEIAAVQAEASAIMATVGGVTTEPWFAAAQYKDIEPDPFPFQVDQDLTIDQAAVDAAIGTWFASGGFDRLEAQLYALEQLALGAVSWRPNSSRIIVWFGDEPGHDPRLGSSEASAIAALQAAEVQVIAIGVRNLDETGQATRIAAATDGVFIPDATADEVVAAILEGLGNLPVTVVPQAVGCDPLVVSFNPTESTVISGESAFFDETITVPADAAVAGQTIDCTVEFRDDNGNLLVVDGVPAIQEITVDIPLAIDLTPDFEVNELSEDNDHTVDAYVSSLEVPLGLGGKQVDFVVTGTNGGPAASGTTDDAGMVSFFYSVPISCNSLGSDSIEGCTDRADGGEECDTVTKDWVDTIPPVAQCVATENPHGDNDPNAPGEGGQGQNQDGFYELLAEDNLVDDCAPLQLFITDNGSGTVFGPFPVGTEIKYIQDPDAIPEIAPMGGNNGNGNGRSRDTDWRIKGTGDAVLTAVDQSGNVSDPVNCLVPPPPQ